MAQRSQSPDGRPGRRGDSTRPPRTRRGGERAPYPGARTRTTPAGTRGTRANSRPGAASAASRRCPSTSSSTRTPATVWTCGPEAIDTHAGWPLPIVETITTAFTAPGAHVVLVDVDAALAAGTAPGTHAAMTSGEVPVAAARDAVRALDRTANTFIVDTRTNTAVAPSRPFWADLVTEPATRPAAAAESASTPARNSAADGTCAGVSDVGERADLVLVSLPAHAAESVSLDGLALLAAHRLRQGGIFAVYTHSDWNRGWLVDPIGAIVAACQHADLLYLQHIVALHTLVRGGHLHVAPSATVAAEYHRARHCATVRGLPAPHLRAHADVLVFAQPADPGTPPPETGSATAAQGGEPATGGHQ